MLHHLLWLSQSLLCLFHNLLAVLDDDALVRVGYLLACHVVCRSIVVSSSSVDVFHACLNLLELVAREVVELEVVEDNPVLTDGSGLADTNLENVTVVDGDAHLVAYSFRILCAPLVEALHR